jgi:hypothetical protein
MQIVVLCSEHPVCRGVPVEEPVPGLHGSISCQKKSEKERLGSKLNHKLFLKY